MSKVFENLNVVNEIDILKKYPIRYDNLTLSNIKYVYKDKEEVNICGKVLGKDMLRANLDILKLTVREYQTSKIFNIVQFNQLYMFRNFEKDNTYFFKLRYRAKTKDFLLLYYLKLDNIYFKNKCRPIYKLPKSVSQSQFEKIIQKLVYKQKSYITNEIPKYFIQKNNLMDLNMMYKYIHFPNLNINEKSMTLKAINQAKYIEALKYATLVELNKLHNSTLKKEFTMQIDSNEAKLFLNFVDKMNIKLTNDQTKVIKEIYEDMNKNIPMFRILIGDVGTGKTLVAAGACFFNFLRNGQSVIMAPTTSLALQHYHFFSEFFKDSDIKVCLIENKISSKNKKDLLEDIKKNKYSIIVGTTSLLNNEIVFNKLSLVIIDEEQKFGVRQRSLLLKKGSNIDILFTTATPIPRTFSRVIYGDMDESRLTQFPFEKRDVQTYVTSSKNDNILKHIKLAISNNQQVFIIVPRIDSQNSRTNLLKVYEKYENIFKDKCQYIYGQLKKEEQLKILEKFKNKEKPILIATSIVEVGIDIKDASLMIIYDSNYFGLSTLHQFRGRIGRNGQKATCILIYDGDDEKTIEKLNFISSHNDGEELSKFDINQRGYGFILGEEQSGISPLGIADFVKFEKLYSHALEDAKYIVMYQNENASFANYIKEITKNNIGKDTNL